MKEKVISHSPYGSGIIRFGHPCGSHRLIRLPRPDPSGLAKTDRKQNPKGMEGI